MDYKNVAKTILEKIGGEKNVVSVTHCLTRLRFVLKDESKADDEQIKAIKGVAGVMKKGGQYQVIIGNDVAQCYQELQKLGDFGKAAEAVDKEKKNPFMAVLDTLSGSMAPVLPAIVGAGMIKILIIVLGFAGQGESTTMQFLNIIGDSAFYFLPILIGFSAAKRFHANPFMVAAIIGVLQHPNFAAIFENATGSVTFLGLPVMQASYTGTFIPSILTAWVMFYIEKLADKITPSVTKSFLRPTITLLISAPIAFMILGPLGAFVGKGLAVAVYAIQAKFGILAMVLVSAMMPFIVMTGMHWAFIPVVFPALSTAAGDTILYPAMLASNLAQGAACLAVAVKSKNSSMKQLSFATGFSAIFAGITEPGMFGVTIRLKRPMIAACIASGITGVFTGLVGLTAHAFAGPSLISIPMFMAPDRPNNFIFALITAGLVMVLSFVITYAMGFEDPLDDEDGNMPKKSVAAVSGESFSPETNTQIVESFRNTAAGKTVYAPLTGDIVPLSQVDDPTFSTEILGKGLAIFPSVGKVFAPFDGEAVSIFDTKHAIGLKSSEGIELLIHVGLETVRLNGKYFTAHVKSGDKIKKGDLLIEFDLEKIREEGYDLITPILVNNVADYTEILSLIGKSIQAGEPVIKVI